MVTHTRRGELLSDVHAEVAGDAGESGGVALADGPELPGAVVAVELAEEDGRLGRVVLAEVEAGDLRAGGLVDDADVGVPDHAEVLLALVRVVDGDREDDLVDLRRDVAQVDLDLLVVAVALAGEVVAGVLHGAVGGEQLAVGARGAVEDEVRVGQDLAVGADEDRGGVEVELGAGGGPRVPAESDVHLGEAGLREGGGEGGQFGVVGTGGGRGQALLGEADVGTGLGERNTHYGCISFRDSEAPRGVSMGLNIPLQVAAVQKETIRVYCRIVK